MNNDKLVELVIRCMPYPNQIRNIDTKLEENAIRFEWRGDKFRVSRSMSVEEVRGSMLHGSNIAIVMESLIKSVVTAKDYKETEK